MLARNAESLYWIGRYVERADDTARILDVVVHQLLEDSSVDPDETSRVLLRVLGITPPDAPLDVWSLTDLVAYSQGTSGGCSIVDAISAARENARGAREVTSTEMWECLNTTYNALAERERAAKRLGPHEFLAYVEGRAAMFAGLADSTLSRDDGYRFMLLGRAIERVDMTVRMLQSRVGDRASSPAWVTVLRSAGAHDTYLRTYRGVLDASRVVEFLLLDRLFPRSVFYSLRLAEHSLDQLLNRPHNRLGTTAEAQRLLGRARSELEFLAPGRLLETLETRLAALQKTCFDVGEALALQYFHSAPWVAWTDAGHSALVIEEGEILMWRMRVVHATGYAYKSPVTASFNEARLTPRSDSRQNVILNRVETVPATRSYRYVDYWGTAVTAFDLHAPHTELEVTGSSVVETDKPESPAVKATWEDLASEAVIDRFDDMLRPTHYTPASKRIERVGRRIAKYHDPQDAVVEAARWVQAELAYVPGSTGVHSSGLDALREGKGVCQDFAHLTLILLRGMGIPARYVSGYLHPKRNAKVGDTIDGQSHAWIQAWTGGWWHYDPTNNSEINEQYISVGVGRDYADVTPLKGIYSGEGSTDLDVVVEITRLA